jgi:hypothetical protein
MALRYSVSSAVQAEGPATLEVGFGAVESEAPEQAERTRPRLAISANAAVFDFFESIINT